MASTYSTDLKLELMATGENSGTWGTKTNTNLDLLQQSIVGYQLVTLTSINTTLVMTDATISNARNAVIEFDGTIAANTTVFVASGIEKTYTLKNSTAGAFTLALNQVGGASVIFGTTDKTTKLVYLNGTDVVDLEVVNLTAPQTLTNKTLTSPALTNATGSLSSPTITTPIIAQINDANSNEEIIFTATASAVNEVTIANAATGNSPIISATGGDTNIGLNLTPKGTGGIVLPAGAVGTPALTTSGDLNTGIFFPSADTIAFTEGGTEAMRINSSGNVGVGKSSPATKLDVNGQIFRNCIFAPGFASAQASSTEITENINYVWASASARGAWAKSGIHPNLNQYTMFNTGTNNSYLVWEMLLNNSYSFTWNVTYSNFSDATSRNVSAEYSLNGGSSYTSAGTGSFSNAGSAILSGTKTFSSPNDGRQIIFRTNYTSGATSNSYLGIETMSFTTNGGELTFIKSLG